ncbi:MAG TPA: type II CAAX endopeptidase family protein [Acidimicrobiia bacterium]|nr:type II CAAX endopeptidase family protein [Acidimicrobiia bacterium]
MTDRWTIVDLVLVVLGALGGSMVGYVIAAALTPDPNVALLSSLVGQFVGSVGVLALISRMRGLGFDSLGFDLRLTDLLYVGVGVALQIGLSVLLAPLQGLLMPEGGPSQELADAFMGLDTPGTKIVMVAVATFMAPLSEELMFRGILLRALQNRSRRAIVLITSLVFAAFHLVGVTSVPAGVIVFIQIVIVGLVLAHVTLRHDRLGPAIFIHGGFNLVAALVLLLPREILEQLEQAGAWLRF